MKLYRFPEEYEKKDTLFRVFCNETEIKTYGCTVSRVPFNQVWPGRQRSLSQTERSAFVSLGNDGETVLTILPQGEFQSVVVRPLAKGARVERVHGGVKVTFPESGQYTVEFDGMHHTLAVFIDPERDYSPEQYGEGVLYFAPGVHHVDTRIVLEDGQTVLIDEGAVVYGSLNAIGKKNIRVVGHGILDNSTMKRQNALQTNMNHMEGSDPTLGLPICFDRCENVSVEGITVVDSSEWCLKFTACRNVSVDNVKVIGLWRYNADGCDFCNCTNATLKNSFLRTFDDVVTVKGLLPRREAPCENITVENCVLWCDWGRCLEVGVETCAPYLKNVVFRKCHLIHGSIVMMDVQQGDSGKVSDVLFEDIHIEYTGDERPIAFESETLTEYPFSEESHTPALFELVSGVTMWSFDERAGDIENVTFRNIRITAPEDKLPLPASIVTREGDSEISRVVLENVTYNGRPLTGEDLRLHVCGNVKDVSL